MSAQTRKHKIHGIEVEQVSYQGKWYTGVAARVQIAEQADPDTIRQDGHGYHVTRVEIIQMGDKWAYHCMVEYPVGSGVIRPGTDFIDLSDKAGIAKAETSAIGRALGLHGIAIEEGIASAEEMRRSGATPDDAPAQSQFAARPPVIHAPADEPAAKHQQRLRQQNDAELAEQSWPFLQDVEFRNALNKRNIRDVASVSAFVANACHKLHEAVTYADRDVCLDAAKSLEGLAGKR